MAVIVDPFNSVGGYTVGIPPIPIIDANGNLTVSQANIGNVSISGDQVVTGNIVANLFVGSFTGNIVGNVVVPGQTTQVLFNDNGNAGASQGFTFDSQAQLVTISGDLVANTITLGSGINEMYTQYAFSAATQSTATDQVIHNVPLNTVSAIEYSIIATDTVANLRSTSKIFAAVLGDEVEFNEYGIVDVPVVTNQGVALFKVSTDGSGSVLLTATPSTSNHTVYKIMVTSYKE